jgi:1-acyl-sn-glycerol-3-phosphate acyltransferase
MKTKVSLGVALRTGIFPFTKTMEDLLRHIGQKIDFLFIDAQTGRLRPDIEIIVNGKEIWFYPEGLRKPVHDKDSIEITLIPLGGG